MSSPSGYGRRVYPAPRPFLPFGEALSAQPSYVTIPAPNDPAVLAGETRTIDLDVNLNVTHISRDIPVDVNATFEYDNNMIHRVTDRLGSSGGMPLPGLRMGRVRAVFVNAGSVTVNPRYELTGFPA